MPYGRRSYRRTNYRRNYRRRNLPNVRKVNYFTPNNIATGVRYAVRTANMLKGIVNAEIKRADYQGSGNISTTPAITLLSRVDQGDEVNQRNGNSILAKYMTWSGAVVQNEAANATLVRMIIFLDNDNDGQTPTASELLTNTTNMHSAINPDYTGRFTILKDRYITMSDSGSKIQHMDIYRKLDFHIKYITGTGLTGFGKSNIWMLLWSNEATNLPAMEYNFRLAYYDN